MPPTTKLDKFLEKFRVDGQGRSFNLWHFDNHTKWFIPSDEYDEFLRLYCSEIKHKSVYLTEKQTRIGQLRVDLDFKYEGPEEVNEHKHTQDQVISFAKAYMESVRKYLEIPESLEIYILEKDYPTIYKTKKDGKDHYTSKSGIHMQIPCIKTQAGIEQRIKRDLLPHMESFFPDLGFKDNWDAVYDKAPLSHNQNWMLLGSQKPDDGAVPYEIKYILNWKNGDITVNTDVPQVITPELIKKLSVRSLDSEETPLTKEGKEYDRPAQEQTATRAVSRGRAPDRGEPGSRSSSPGRNYVAPLTESNEKYIRAHVMNLAEFRHSGAHDEYVKVGQTLKNIHEDLEDVWLDFMEQSSDEGRRRKAIEKWRGFGFRVEGERSGIGSLRHWSREDNPEQYRKIEESNVDRMVDEAAKSGTEYDVAQVIYCQFRDEFKCANFKNNEWYHYVGHIWRNTDNGVELIRRLSTDISKLFLVKEQVEINNITANGNCEHNGKEKRDPSCPTCQAEERKKKYSDVRLKLKRTGFKDSVMKECRVLFFDKDFARKLDDNKHLIAFNNGVYDTLTQSFREGRSEDCISFCTNIDYALDTQYYEFKCWPEVNKFLHDILPNPNVRDYFLKHLATCLSGVFNQRFHILTGSGSNGKSMLMNLCATAFGEYFYKANVAMFTQKRGKAGAASPEMVRMKGRRFVMMSEPDEGEPLSTGFMKEITSSEKIIARDLFAGSKQMVEFDVQAKCHLACNDKPKVNTTDGGTWRRLKVIDFPSKFVVNPIPGTNQLPMDETIENKVLSKEWAECFMAYLVHLYTEGKGLHKLVPPKEVEAYTNEYKEDSDAIAKFMSEFFHPPMAPAGDEPEVGVTWNAIQAQFAQWKRENEARASVTELRKRIEAQYGALPKHNGGIGWTTFRFGSD